jgi:predicted transcriptional regulator
MRVTIHVSDKIGESLKRTASRRGVSTSRLAASVLEEYLERQRKKELGEKVLEIAARARVAADALEVLEEGRSDGCRA